MRELYSILQDTEHGHKKMRKSGRLLIRSRATRQQLGLICEGSMNNDQDTCLDTEQNICHFEAHAVNQTTLLVYIGQGCVCLRMPCSTIVVDNLTINGTQSNLCICNFVKIEGCDFSHPAPVVSHQYIKANLATVQEVSPVPIGMNLTLVEHLLKHEDLKKILEEIKIMGKKTLIIIHHDTETIRRVFKRLEGDMSHHWWDVLFGWSPEATGILNAFVHPIIVLLILVSMSLILSIVIVVWNWRMLRRVATLTSLSKA